MLAAHGTRSPAGRTRIRALQHRLAERLPHRRVLLGHVDVQDPTLTEAIAEADSPPVVLPLFLTAGVHVRTDVSEAAAARTGTDITPWLGTLDVIADLHLRTLATLPTDGRPIALIAAGSSDERAHKELTALAQRLTTTSGRTITPAVFGGLGTPVADVLPHLSGVLTHLLAPGHFARRVEELTQPRGIPIGEPLLASDHRVDAIAKALAALVSDSCR